jgi:hypothetical protein
MVGCGRRQLTFQIIEKTTLATLGLVSLDQGVLKVDILDAKPQRFTDSQSAAVQQFGDHQRYALKLLEYMSHLRRAQYCRDLLSLARADRLNATDVTFEDVLE